MKALFFLVQITPGFNTRFSEEMPGERPDQLLKRVIQSNTERSCEFYSQGSIPDVIVRPIQPGETVVIETGVTA